MPSLGGGAKLPVCLFRMGLGGVAYETPGSLEQQRACSSDSIRLQRAADRLGVLHAIGHRVVKLHLGTDSANRATGCSIILAGGERRSSRNAPGSVMWQQ